MNEWNTEEKLHQQLFLEECDVSNKKTNFIIISGYFSTRVHKINLKRSYIVRLSTIVKPLGEVTNGPVKVMFI